MAAYDLEEQDQLEELKAWWAQWGSAVTIGLILACVVVAGVQGWRWWRHNQAEQASALYSAVSTAQRGNDIAKAKDATAQLVDRYGSTAYAPRAALLTARMLFDSGDKAGAKAQLQWVADHGGDGDLQQIARMRLAEIQLDEKQYDEALRTLDAKHDDAYAGVYADLRGDVLLAAGRSPEARSAYQIAFAKLDAKSPYRAYVQVKLDALGGPTADASPAAAAGGTAAPAAKAAGAPAQSPPAAAATAPAPAKP